MLSSASPRTTQASFQARFATSRRPGDQTLARERRRHVRSVTGEEAAALGERSGLARLEAVDRGALDADVVDVAPGREQAAHRLGPLHLLGALARLEHELPALASARRHHVRGRPARIADELAVVDRVGHVQRIDDQPVLRKGAAFELEAEQAAHQRVRTVRADQIARAHLQRRAVAAFEARLHLTAVVDEALQRDAEAHLDARILRELRAQQLLELGLVERDEHRLAVDDAGAVDAGESPEQRRVVLDLRQGDGRELAVAHAHQLEDAQGLVVERDRTRLGEDLGRLVDCQHAHAVAAEQIRERSTYRPEADDEHVGVDRGPYGRAARCVCVRSNVRHTPPFMPL